MEKARNKFPWLSLFALAFGYAAAYNPPYIRYVLYDSMIEAMGCTNVQLAFLTTFTYIIGYCNTIFGGWVADKFSTKKILVISLLGNFPLVLLSNMFVSTYWIQLVAWGGFGFTTGFAFWPAILKAVRVVGGSEQSTTYGIFESAQGVIASIGNMIALALFARFVDHVWGYRVAHMSMGVLCVIAAVLVAGFYKDEEKAPEPTAEMTEEEKQKAEEEKFHIRDTITLLKNPGLWMVALTVAGVYGLYVCQTYMTPYFTGVLGAALTLAGFFAIMRDGGIKIISGPLGGTIAKKIGSPALLNSICLCICAVMIFIISRLQAGTPNIVAIAIAFVLLNSFVLCMAKATMWATMDEAHLPLKVTGTAVVFVSMIGVKFTDSVLPVINGWLLDTFADDLHRAYGYYFTILICLALVGAAAAFLLYLRSRRFKKLEAENQG